MLDRQGIKVGDLGIAKKKALINLKGTKFGDSFVNNLNNSESETLNDNKINKTEN